MGYILLLWVVFYPPDALTVEARFIIGALAIIAIEVDSLTDKVRDMLAKMKELIDRRETKP